MELSKAIVQYLLSTIRHKAFVFWAGWKIVGGISLWRLFIHDWTKFLPVEFVNYAKYYELPSGSKKHPNAFIKAWMHHQKNNKHHPEYWTTVGTFDWANRSVLMPKPYVREWVADLLGASMEYTGGWDMTAWLKENISKWDYSHRSTLAYLSAVLCEIGYPIEDYTDIGMALVFNDHQG